jgi:hypothetical protein
VIVLLSRSAACKPAAVSSASIRFRMA